MKRTQISDEWLCLHMPVLGDKMLNALPEENEISYEFSDKFLEKMKKLLRRAELKEKYGVPVSAWKRTAASVAVVLSGILMASLAVEAIRTEIYEFIQERYESFTRTEYQVIKNEPVEFVPMYPEYVPEGYEVDICDIAEDLAYISYMNSDKKGFWIMQDYVIDKMAEYEDNEYIHQKNVEILEEEAVLGIKQNGVIHVKWKTKDCMYVFVADDMDETEVLKICNSLKK